MDRFKVQAQALIELEIDAEDEASAEIIMCNRLRDEFAIDTIDWGISAYKLDENKKIIWPRERLICSK